jgi:5-formyltetrahydrofolate cyclo-ligase
VNDVPATDADRLKREKRAIRARVRALRDALDPAERARASAAIAASVLALPELEDVRTVMVFASFGTEVDTRPIVDGLDARGVRVAMPRVDGPHIAPVVYRPGDRMVTAAFGMPEPGGEEIVDLGHIGAAVTPGLAFDRAGHRIGYGGGFYDRFFAQARPELRKIAVGFSIQILDEELPHGAFDVPVDVVVTEREVLRPA